MKQRIALISALLPLVVALALTATTSLAEKGVSLAIYDDPNPFGSSVAVTVVNPEGFKQSAYVEVRAWLGDIPARRVEPVTVGPYGTVTMYVPFGSEVTGVDFAAIIEDPDPIPV